MSSNHNINTEAKAIRNSLSSFVFRSRQQVSPILPRPHHELIRSEEVVYYCKSAGSECGQGYLLKCRCCSANRALRLLALLCPNSKPDGLSCYSCSSANRGDDWR